MPLDLDIGKFTVIGKHVLLKRDAPDDKRGGIFIPDQYKLHGNSATILQVGQRVENIAVGDRMFYLREYTILPFRDRSLAMTDCDKIPARLWVNSSSAEEVHPLGKYILIEPFPQVVKKDAIYLPDQSIKRASGGYVARVGPDCECAVKGNTAYYNTHKAIICAEDDVMYHLVSEDEIDCLIQKE